MRLRLMMLRIAKYSLLICLIMAEAALVARAAFLHYAEAKADAIIAEAQGNSVEETVVNIARYASERFVVSGRPDCVWRT